VVLNQYPLAFISQNERLKNLRTEGIWDLIKKVVHNLSVSNFEISLPKML